MDVQRIRQLLDQRESIDRELTLLVTATPISQAKKSPTCSMCGGEGHTARSCPSRHIAADYEDGAAKIDAFNGQ